MALPSTDALKLPTLKALVDGHEATRDEIRHRVTISEGLATADLSQMPPGGRTSSFASRLSWNLTYLKKAGLIESVRWGVWRITPQGQDLLATDPLIINRAVLKRYPEFVEWKWRKKREKDRNQKTSGSKPGPASVVDIEGFAQLLREANDWFHQDDSDRAADRDSTRPTELLEGIVQKMDAVMRVSLLSRIRKASRQQLGRVVDDLLVQLGYAGHHPRNGNSWRDVRPVPEGAALARTLCLDLLGLDRTYVQVYTGPKPVDIDKLLAFANAMETSRATKGILIATAHFANSARETFAHAPGHRQIALIDGNQLVQLMMDHDIGINDAAHFRVRTIDPAYFQP